MGRRIKRHSVISKLPDHIRTTVEQMILTNGIRYCDIVDYLKDKNVSLTESAICRYARAYQADNQMLQIAQENFRRMMEEMDKYPSLDTTEGIVRLLSQNVFHRLASASPEEWSDVSMDKLIRETNALIRATAYKRRTDVQNEDAMDVGLEKVKSLLFDTMAREDPELYKRVAAYISGMKESRHEEESI
jgi:hypothetical protein